MRIDTSHYETASLFAIAARLESIVTYGLELELLRRSDLVTTVSRSVASELKGYGLDPDSVVVLGNGVDEDVFSPPEHDVSSSRYVLYTGRLGFRKGLFDLIKCAKQICDEQPDVKFVLTGSGPLLGWLNETAMRMGLEGKTIFTGQVTKDRLIQLYQNATVCVVPSHYEGLPTVLLEAMSCGRPVVATAVGDNIEVINSGVNGILVPPGTQGIVAMVQAISRLLDDEHLRRNMGIAARRTIEEKHTLEQLSERVLDCYSSTLRCAGHSLN
jgi:glycosyltransferase involved in cell wall biosynthesis